MITRITGLVIKNNIVTGEKMLINHFFPSWGSNPCRRVRNQTLYLVTIKACFYSKGVQMLIYLALLQYFKISYLLQLYLPLYVLKDEERNCLVVTCFAGMLKVLVTRTHVFRGGGGAANNKGTDQPAHPRSLISAFVIRLLESIISRLATSEISTF